MHIYEDPAALRPRPLLLRSNGDTQGFALSGDLACARLKSPLPATRLLRLRRQVTESRRVRSQ
jgi:hypothetical protein